jgi:hypothetical protein
MVAGMAAEFPFAFKGVASVLADGVSNLDSS